MTLTGDRDRKRRRWRAGSQRELEVVMEEAAENMPSLKGFTWHCLRDTFDHARDVIRTRTPLQSLAIRLKLARSDHKSVAVRMPEKHLTDEDVRQMFHTISDRLTGS